MAFVQTYTYCFIFLISLLFQLGLCNSDVSVLPTSTPVPVENESNETVSARILGGGPAEDFVIKRMVNIWSRTGDGIENSFQVCSGTVFARDWLFTAAHCFYRGGILSPRSVLSANKLFAVIGGANAKYKINDEDIGPYFFEAVYVHKDFEPHTKNFANDIAVIKLNRTIARSKFSPVSISRYANKKFIANRSVSAAGYGIIDNMDTPTDVLMEADLMTKPFSECINRTSPGFGRFLDDNKIICAVSVGFPIKGATDTCTGDSGGPLLIGDEKTDFFFQIGITSFGPRMCAMSGSVAWYTRVSYYFEQVEEAINSNFDSWTALE